MKSHFLTFCLVGAAMAGPAVALAETDDGLHLSLGVAGLYRPEFKGSKDYEFKPLPFVGLRYDRGAYYVALEGGALRANLAPGGFVEAGPVVTYERGRKDDIENVVVRRLGEIDAAVNAGGFVRKRFDVAGGQLSLEAEALVDTGKVHEGTLVNLGLGYDRALNDRWSVGASLATTWADEKYMQAYYGVSAAGARASGLAPYAAKAGMEKIELNAALRYRINDHWSALGQGSYGRLVDNAADSPIVAREGSTNQGQFAFALIYSF